MAYTDPTASDLKTLFPQFAAVPDATVTAWIGVAKTQVDTTWLETDYTYGIELYAAYLMTDKGLGTGVEAEIAAQGMSGFNSIRSGQLSLQRNSPSSNGGGDAPAPWNKNGYGVEFYWLMRKNKPPAAVAVSGSVGCSDWLSPLAGQARLYPWGY